MSAIPDLSASQPPPGAILATPRVSVVMLTFKRPQLIDRAIQSVLAQDYQDWELIVVQDGANERVEEIVGAWTERDNRIRYFYRKWSGNIGDAYNFALERARGEYIAILDDDDYWIVPDKLSRQVAFLNACTDYAGCGAGMIVVDETGQELIRYLKPEQDANIKKLALVANPMAHSTTMFRRRMSGQLTRYDDSLSGLQDWDFWLNLGRRGKLYNFPEPFTGYTLWNNGSSFVRQRANARAAWQIVWRHRGSYAWFSGGLALAVLHYIYSLLPPLVARRSYSHLSCLKKIVFSEARGK